MSSFFTLPASKKRKRPTPSTKPTISDRRNKSKDDDSISGSDISDEDGQVGAGQFENSEDDEEDDENEDVASKRIRLAEQYLANTQKEVLEDGGFDAAEVDQENLRRRMGERLKEDTAESKGRLYRTIADGIDWQRADKRALRCQGVSKSFTAVAIHGNHAYAVSKDLYLAKWQMPDTTVVSKGHRPTRKWKVVAYSRGNRKKTRDQHHHAPILCVAVSQDGKFVATGGADKKLIIWSADTLKPLKVFTHHRDAVTALTFRRGTNQLFSASKDRTIKIWSLDELAYVETLFGHQDEVVDVGALAQEKCVTVGARDRTARLWKVVEESQLVFRGGGAPGTYKALESLKKAYGENDTTTQDNERYHEGSMDRIAMIEDDTFVTASDNGSLSLWNIHKKKAVFTLPLAHGMDPALALEQASAEVEPDETLDERSRGGKQPRWITALRAIPFSDVLISGSWDGYIRVWKITGDKRRIEPLGVVGAPAGQNVDSLLEKEGLSSESLSSGALQALQTSVKRQGPLDGIINDLSIVDRGDRGKDGILIAAAVGREHRLGRWKEMIDGKDSVVMFEVPKKGDELDADEDGNGSSDYHTALEGDEAGFEGFD